MSAWEKKGTLTVRHDATGQSAPQGGNIVSYVCTPDGRVIHAILGAPPPEVYRTELRWALALWDAGPDDRARRIQEAHGAGQNLIAMNIQVPDVHALLARAPLPDVRAIEREVFETLLGVPYEADGPLVRQLVPNLFVFEFG